MHSFRAFITASLALVGLATAGCPGSEETASSPYMLEDVPLRSSEVGGSSGTNSLDVYSFDGEQGALRDIATRRIKNSSPAGTHAMNSLSTYMVGTPEGREILTYAARCGLADNDYIMTGAFPAFSLFPGEGLLTTTSGWGSAALTNAQTEDLFTCVLTHLNPNGAEIAIYLKGPSVADDNSDGTAFDFIEAVWLTTITLNGTLPPVIEHHVWPMQDLKDACGPWLEGSLMTRVCGTPTGCSSLIIHTDAHFAANCTGSDGSYTCLGKPAIQTRLKTVDLPGLHRQCH